MENLALRLDTPISVLIGDAFRVNHHIANNGAGTAYRVLLTTSFSADTELVGALPARCSSTAPGTVVCDLGALAPGGTTQLALTLRSKVVGVTCDLWGSSGNDLLVGTPGRSQVLCGLGGSDRLVGEGSDDTLWGNAPPGARSFVARLVAGVTSTLAEADLSDNLARAPVRVAVAPDGDDQLDCARAPALPADPPSLQCLPVPVVVPPVITIPTGSPAPSPLAEPTSAPTESPAPTERPTPTPDPVGGLGSGELSLDAPSALPGGAARVSGSGCVAGEAVLFSVGGASVGSAVAGPDGRYAATLELPALPLGQHTVDARCGQTRVSTVIDLVVSTGTVTPAVASTAGLILVFLLLGGLLLVQYKPGPRLVRLPNEESDS